MDETIVIRKVTPQDAEALLAIYAPYVESTAVTFEYEVPTLPEFQKRVEGICHQYPFLAAVKGDTILGYAYTSRFHPRDAYQWCAETAIYLNMDARRKGIGRALYEMLEQISRKQGIRNLNACIAYPSAPDQYLDFTSAWFHESMGYRKAAHFHRCGYKFGRWYDMIWMEKEIWTDPDPSPVVSFDALAFEPVTLKVGKE